MYIFTSRERVGALLVLRVYAATAAAGLLLLSLHFERVTLPFFPRVEFIF